MTPNCGYPALAEILGNALATARARFGEDGYALIYDAVYTPTVEMLAADNPYFNITRFSYAVAKVCNP